MQIRHEADLDHLRRAAQAHALIGAWQRAGIFQALADGQPRRADELPGDSRAISATAPLLAHMGLLIHQGGRWALSATGLSLQHAGVLTGATEQALGDLSRLDEVIREGGPAHGPDGRSRATDVGVQASDVEGTRRFLTWLHDRSASAAKAVTRWSQPHLAQGSHVLDLGGGHGRYAHAFVEAGYSATLFDFPWVVDLARERYGRALDYRGGDFRRDHLGGPYDAALLSNIVHGLGPEQTQALFTQLRSSLTPDGLVIIKDMLVDDFGTDPENAVFFQLTMLMYTEHGRSYSVSALRGLLEAEGYQYLDTVYLRDEGSSLLFARAKT